MSSTITQVVGAVTRSVSSRDVGDAAARVIAATRSYPASPAEVWDALATGERLSRWFLPISGELRPGGRYQLEGNAGGEILECEPHRRLAVTWEMHDQVSWLTVNLGADGSGGTRLEVEHVAHVPHEFWDQFGAGAVGVGWDQAMFGLDRYLATGQGVDPQDAVRWLSSDEGLSFVQQSSDAWCAASIAAGEDPIAARAAAARTAAAYTGGG